MSVDLTAAKQHLRKTASDEDTIITRYLNAAIAWVENYTRRKLTADTEVTETFPSFPGDPYAFVLSWGPEPTDITVEYIDGQGDAQSITTALLVGSNLYPPADSEWPGIQTNTPVTVTYSVGSTSLADLDMAVLLLVAEYHQNRAAGEAAPAITAAVQSLCASYRLPTIR